MRVDVFQMCPDLDVPSRASHTLPSLLGRERDVGSSSGSRGRLHLQIQKQQGLWGPGRQEVGRMGRYLEEGVLEAVLLAPSTALGHEVVSPPAAEREKVKPCSAAGACGQARSSQCQEAMPGRLGPEWGSLSEGPVSAPQGSSSGGVDRMWGLENLSLKWHEPLTEIKLFLKF